MTLSFNISLRLFLVLLVFFFPSAKCACDVHGWVDDANAPNATIVYGPDFVGGLDDGTAASCLWFDSQRFLFETSGQPADLGIMCVPTKQLPADKIFIAIHIFNITTGKTVCYSNTSDAREKPYYARLAFQTLCGSVQIQAAQFKNVTRYTNQNLHGLSFTLQFTTSLYGTMYSNWSGYIQDVNNTFSFLHYPLQRIQDGVFALSYDVSFPRRVDSEEWLGVSIGYQPDPTSTTDFCWAGRPSRIPIRAPPPAYYLTLSGERSVAYPFGVPTGTFGQKCSGCTVSGNILTGCNCGGGACASVDFTKCPNFNVGVWDINQCPIPMCQASIPTNPPLPPIDIPTPESSKGFKAGVEGIVSVLTILSLYLFSM